MNKVDQAPIGLDVSEYDISSTTFDECARDLYKSNPNLSNIVDSLNLAFGVGFGETAVERSARVGTCTRAAKDHLDTLESNDHRAICTVLFESVRLGGVEKTDLSTCMRLIIDADYVASQVGTKFVDRVVFRLQQVLRLKDVSQVLKFVNAYSNFETSDLIRRQFALAAGSLMARRQASSGLPSGLM